MFESHFGLSGPPFQLSPDPAFYFDSRGHANALAYLKFGVYQGEGFIVVTGEVGAGKTTLVRALLGALNRDQIVAAQVVSTQLESGDLLRAISAAFGIPPAGRGKADLILSLESFMTALATTNRRALLIVDEAQNLSPEAVEELRMLSNFQLGNRALMQSFLIGQPELRAMLESRTMEQFRQRVIASCHLGPLDPGETRAYIEHRLHVVGWQDRPSFEPAAFDEIHLATDGIPRRINQLCNRLLLAAFLGTSNQITRADVKRVSREMRGEVGEDPSSRLAPHRPQARASGAPLPPKWVHAEQQVASIATDTGIVQCVNQSGVNVERPLLCVAGHARSFAAIGVLSRALTGFAEMPQVVVVNPGEAHAVALGDSGAADEVCAPVEVHLGALANLEGPSCMAALAPKLESLITEMAPRAILTIDDDEAGLVAAALARAHGVPLLRVQARAAGGHGYAAAINRLSDLVYGAPDTVETLGRQGLEAERCAGLGDLAGNLLQKLYTHLPPAVSVLARQGVARVAPGRFVLVSAQYGGAEESASERHDLAALVGQLARRAPTVWLVSEPCMASLLSHGLYGRVQSEGVVLLPSASYFDALAVLNGAGCLVLGADRRLGQEADALGVPCIALGGGRSPAESGTTARSAEQALLAVEEVLGYASGTRGAPSFPESAGRIAEHLRAWLGARLANPADHDAHTVLTS